MVLPTADDHVATHLSHPVRAGVAGLADVPAEHLGAHGAHVGTHLHYDHAENNLLLPDAQFYVSLAEWEYAKNPIATQRWLYDFAWTDEVVSFQNYRLVATDHYEVRPGVRLIQTPGHSRGHQSVLLNTEQGVLCVAGDAACFLENFTRPTPPGGLTSVEQALESLERMREQSDAVLMAHDTELDKFQNGGFPAMPKTVPVNVTPW